MLRWSFLALVIGVVAFSVACGPSELGCREDCANAFIKSHTLCNSTHGRSSQEGIDCNKLAIADSDQCSARCYGG